MKPAEDTANPPDGAAEDDVDRPVEWDAATMADLHRRVADAPPLQQWQVDRLSSMLLRAHDEGAARPAAPVVPARRSGRRVADSSST